jgi:hydroxymethylbilane synthase
VKPVIVGSRGSPLALAQTRLVMAELERAWPGRVFELRIVKTQGDRLSEDPARLAGATLNKGLFTAELERALLAGDIHLAIHSLKDLPTTPVEGLTIAAIPLRADARDRLITRAVTSLADLPADAFVATGSPRRSAQLCLARPDLCIAPIRGNIDTRLRKFRENAAWHGLILAAAGLDRLQPDMGDLVATPLPFDLMLPAPGQGALALQVSATDPEMEKIVRVIHDAATAAHVAAERTFLQALGGGCEEPIAAYAFSSGAEIVLQGIAWLHEEDAPRRGTVRGHLRDPAALGRQLAEEISR